MIDFEALDTSLTYMFEVVSECPMHGIVFPFFAVYVYNARCCCVLTPASKLSHSFPCKTHSLLYMHATHDADVNYVYVYAVAWNEW